jgi:hypothetical protein
MDSRAKIPLCAGGFGSRMSSQRAGDAAIVNFSKASGVGIGDESA